jgi:hypothetical protein
MKKEDLRRVHYGTLSFCEAYFHHWLKLKDDDGSEYTKAFIELPDGKTKEVYPNEIKFID